MPPKKGPQPGGKHAARFLDRTTGRLKNFVKNGRTFDANQLAAEVAGGWRDIIDLWGGLFGYGGSPQAPVVELGPSPQGTWRAAAGVRATVTLDDPVPDTATLPTGAMDFHTIDNSATVQISLLSVAVVDYSDGFELKIIARDTANNLQSNTEYFGTLFYTDGGVNSFVAYMHATVM